MKHKDFFQGFSKLNRKERLQKLLESGVLDEEDVQLLKKKTFFSFDLAEKWIENVIGYWQMPFGVVPQLEMDGRSYVVPMAIEETSVVAAASKTAKWIKEKGEIRTQVLGRDNIGQIQIARIQNKTFFLKSLMKEKKHLIEEANRKAVPNLFRRGGGVKDLELRYLNRPDGDTMGVIHVLVDCSNAMGANSVNQICEFLKEPIEKITGEKVSMCILSNLSDKHLVRAEILLFDLPASVVEKLEEGSLFAFQDPYRACTHNKGIMNAIDALLIATGNDWRAVEAGSHAYAALGGSFKRKQNPGGYAPLSVWKEWKGKGPLNGLGDSKRREKQGKKENNRSEPRLFSSSFLKKRDLARRKFLKENRNNKDLFGAIEIPLSLGIVGGLTALHPMSSLALKMLKVKSSDELARICSALGLVQNLGALMALTTWGIVKGHMKLHIQNLVLSSGAKKEEITQVQKKLEKILALKIPVTLTHAIQALKELRSGKSSLK